MIPSLLVLLVATVATGRVPHPLGASRVSSGRPGGTPRSLVGTVAGGGRAQCGVAGPCGRIPPPGATLLATICHPRATSDPATRLTNATDDVTADVTTRVTNATDDVTTDVTNATDDVTTDVTGVPELEELLVALEPNPPSARGQELSPPPPELLQVPGFPGGGTTPPPRHSPTAPGPTASGQLSVTQRYVLGSVAGLALTLSPLVALSLLRCPPRPRAQRWLRPPMLGLAAGALSGDALLHLLPQLLGVHSHGEEGSQPHGEGGSQPHGEGGSQPHMGDSGLPWPLLGVLGGLYAAFLLEKLLGILLGPPRHQGGPQGDLAVGQQQRGGQEDVGQQLGVSTTELVKMEDGVLPPGGQELQKQAPPTLPWMVTLGHGAHGLVDGLALGAAFATSGASGVATGLALLCHELPHALGEVAVLAQAGVSWRRGLALGLGGALPVLPGVYVGLALGGTATARAWLGATATGLLLHLALCDMVPAMLSCGEGPPWALLLLQSLGLLGGWGGLLLLALYEGSILR